MRISRSFNLLFCFTLVFLFTICFSAQSQTRLDKIKLNNNSPLNSALSKGIIHLYNLDFDDAKKEFNKAIEADNESPVGYFYTAMIYWERLLNNPRDKEAVRLFEEWTLKSIDICNKRIEKKGKDDETLFYLGGSYGFKARGELIKKSWFNAFLNAKKGRKFLKEAFVKNPNNYDIYLGLGMYDYFLDKMPKIIKFFSFLLSFSGNKELGLQELHKCASEGKFAKTEAKFVLVSIYTYLEKDYEKALPIAVELNKTYPKNPRFCYTISIIYSKMKKWDEAIKLADEISRRAENKEPNFTSSWIPRTNYLRGEIYREIENYAEAIKFYNIAINSDLSKNSWVLPWCHLRIGMIYDVTGQREKAKLEYKKVLKLEDISEENTYVHEFAKKYLDKPYNKNEPAIPE